MPRRRKDILMRARERIARIRATLNAMDHLCSGTLQRRMMICGKPNCRCTHDPDARHGPYARKLMRAWEKETERLIDAETSG
jgi:hypothetical protein